MDEHTTPRLYTPHALRDQQPIELEGAQAHYLKNVMRLKDGQNVRLFNGRDGEFFCRIESLVKKAALVLPLRRLKTQPEDRRKIHLLFAPLKKHRMDMIIEKSVELGVTDLHPVLTARTEVRTLNTDRVTAQIIEAAEQSERLDFPALHAVQPLKESMRQWDSTKPLFWGAEMQKDQAPLLTQSMHARAFLIGPVGGFDPQECDFLMALPFIRPVSLGPRVLRAETAAIVCMALSLNT